MNSTSWRIFSYLLVQCRVTRILLKKKIQLEWYFSICVNVRDCNDDDDGCESENKQKREKRRKGRE